LEKAEHIRIQKCQRPFVKLNSQRTTLGHTMINVQKAKDKERTLKAERYKKQNI
jgi:hypothetical protein